MTLEHWKSAAIAIALMLVGGAIFASEANRTVSGASIAMTKAEIIRYLRERFSLEKTTELKVGPFEDSEFRDFYKTRVETITGKETLVRDAYVTKDGHYLIFGNIFMLGSDPRFEVERQINLKNQPSIGPTNAPVTIVEYADLECPACRDMHQFLVHDLISKYGNKVRVVFKEFPLYKRHPWALEAAIADQCAYEVDPPLFFKYQSMIYDDQNVINATNVHSLLLDYGETVGINRLKLATCIDSRVTLPRVEADLREGYKLGIFSTPTFFINGQLVDRHLSPVQFYAVVNKALKDAR